MKVFKHRDYKQYVASQVKVSKAKAKCIWAFEETIRYISEYVSENMMDFNMGICHGVRNGWEVNTFRNFLKNRNIIGTEISPVGAVNPNVIKWDFHDIKEEWLGNIDFIYSNSLDHSYDPELALKSWMSCLKPETGRCFLEWDGSHDEDHGVNSADCFKASLEEYKQMIEKQFEIEKIEPVEYVRTRGKMCGHKFIRNVIIIKNKKEV